jgi:hypothetical protein
MILVAVTVQWTAGGVRIQAMAKCPTCDTVIVRPLSMVHQTTHCQECFAIGRSLVKVKGTRLYRIWNGMKTRCSNPNRSYWHCYGGRGITVCDEWKNDFFAFKTWAMTHGYEKGLTIERRDNNLGYSPENCRWIPQSDQARNARTNAVTAEEAKNIRALLNEGI